jgi:hypothetical protein
MLVRRAYGVLVEGLAEPHARALARALAARGIHVDSVAQGWLELPPVTACRRAELGPRGLVVYDVYDRALELPWSRVLLVTVGSYPVAERQPVTRKPFEVVPGNPLFGDADRLIGHADYEYVDRPQIVLDIVADVPVRYRIQHQRFDYSYLGARRGPSASVNFPLLVRDLLEHVPHAILTQGARALRSDIGELSSCRSYPGPTQYEREIAWSLWRFLGPGMRLDGGDPYRSSSAAGPRLTMPLMRSKPAAARSRAPASQKDARTQSGEIAPGDEVAPVGPYAPVAAGRTRGRAGLAVLGGVAVAVAGWWLDPLAALLALPVMHVIFHRGQRRAEDATPEQHSEP